MVQWTSTFMIGITTVVTNSDDTMNVYTNALPGGLYHHSPINLK
jgi:hypothetical protein